MSVHVCPRCNVRFIVSPDCDDFEHVCNSGNTTLDQENVVTIGDWEDYTGSGKVTNPFTLGAENTLFGSRAAIEGEREQDKTVRGHRASTTRQRQHIEHINLDGAKC